jgi:hypothetical protein
MGKRVTVNLNLINHITVRYIFLIFLFAVIGLSLKSQVITEPDEGTVSYISSQNIYVKFKSTEGLAVGDTLFLKKGETVVPALVVNSLSSISCVCTPISSEPIAVADKIVFKQKPGKEPVKEQAEIPPEPILLPVPDEKTGTPEIDTTKRIKPEQVISGRVSVSSYSNFSNTPGGNSQRMRYTFSINAKNIADTKLSGESYISFVHRDGEWSEIQDNIFNGLKIYSLALKYEFNDNYRIWLGRKINPRISNMGAIDGLQFEMKVGSFTAGILAGSRPDTGDYSINVHLFQYGAYLSHDLSLKNGNMQSSLAFAEQQNHGNTDRRFIYFQHSNSLIKNLNFFGTLEFDLYNYDTVTEKLQNTFHLSNVYISLRYRVIKQLSFTASYSSRQNVIYYETYKNILDQILDYESLQGFMFQVNYNPVKYLSVGVRTGYRYKKSDPRASKNLYAYVTYSRIPLLDLSSTISATLLETGYMSGQIYSLTVSRDLVKGKLYGTCGYRYVDYSYFNSEISTHQNMAELNLSWHIYKKLSLSLNYEGTFEKDNKYNRLYINVTQRF